MAAAVSRKRVGQHGQGGFAWQAQGTEAGRPGRSVLGRAEARMNGPGLGALALLGWFLRAWPGPGLEGRTQGQAETPALMPTRGAWSDAEGQGDLLRIHAAAHPPVTQDPGMVQPSPSWRGSIWGWTLCVRGQTLGMTGGWLRTPKSSGAGPQAAGGTWAPGREVYRKGEEPTYGVEGGVARHRLKTWRRCLRLC